MISEAWIGWTAGIIDGEGCIHIRGSKRNDTKSQNIKYQAVLEVQNTDLSMLLKLQTLWGGFIDEPKNRNIKWRKYYRWTIVSKSIVVILKTCLPYLITKKNQAELALQFQQRIIENHVDYWGKVLPENETELRAQMYCRMKQYNQRGVWESGSPQSGS